MPRCAWLFCLFLLFPLASTSFALDMTWSTGSKDISVQSAKPCTLVVGTLGGTETLPGGWRLIWTALTGETEPITLLTGVAAEDAANVCRVATAPSAEYLISRVDTAAFCSGDSFARATVARFFLKIPAGAVGKIKLLPENMVAMDSLAALRVESLPEVTINGGLTSSYPPLLTSVDETRVGSAVFLTVGGAFLGSIRSISLVDSTATVRAQFQILGHGDTWLKAQATSFEPMSPCYIMVTDHDGQTSALLAPPTTVASTPTVPTDRFLVRFKAGQVEPSDGQSAGPLATFQSPSAALVDSLASVGVTALERLLPWASRATAFRSTRCVLSTTHVSTLSLPGCSS